MAGESSNISKMAEFLSDEVFSEFFWEKVGPVNENWPCEESEKHSCSTHPADVVFYYDEPYTQERTYVHCDLKSYAKTSIQTNAIQNALTSLAKQVACAEKSDTWRKRYMHENVNPSVCGLLFVYNHDGEYDRTFHSHLTSVKQDKLNLPKGSKLCVLGPEDVFWLDNVRYEIRQMRGKAGTDKLPDAKHCRYFYPQLDRHANIQPIKARAATIEMLTSSWIVLEYEKQERKGMIVFYRRSGETEAEFVYLLDYLRHYQLLNSQTDIVVKTLAETNATHAMFQKAQHTYISGFCGESGSDLADYVKAIKFSRMTQVVTTFSTEEIGMDYE